MGKRKLPRLAPTPRREPSGRPQRTAESIAEKNSSRVALTARARAMGLPDGKHGQHQMRAPWYECDQGKAIAIHHAHDAEKIAPLWQVWAQMTGADYSYCRQYLDTSRHPAGASIAPVREPVEARPEDRPDDRTPDEKVRDAKNRKAAWDGHMRGLDYWDRIALDVQMIGGGPALIRDKALTTPGRKFVEALGNLAEQVRKR